MGATSYFNSSYYSTDPREAFRDQQRIVGAEDGSGMYAGNISIVPGFNIASRTPLTEWEASQKANIRYDGMDKWGAGEAVPLLPRTGMKTQKKTVKLNLTEAHNASLEAKRSWFNEFESINNMVSDKLRDGERIVGLRIVESEPVWKPVVKRSTGKATRCFVLKARGRETRFDTLAEAIEASKRYVTHQTSQTSVSIHEEVLRGSEPRVKVETALMKHMATVEVTIIRPTAKQANTIGGWAFYGMAPC